MGVVTERRVRLNIPGIEIVYEKDHKDKRGKIVVNFKRSSWAICYQHENLTYFPPDVKNGSSRWIDIYLDITKEPLKVIWRKDKETGKFYVKEIPEWLIRDYGTEFKIITHAKEEIENAEELIEPKLIKRVVPGLFLEFYRRNKILKIPFFKDNIRINIENENLEYIRNNKKLIKAFPLNKEIHFYRIEPKVIRYVVTSEGAKLATM